MSKTIGEAAAFIHADMCNNNDNGYSWDPRWGEDGKGVRTIVFDGRKFSYDQGSYECGTSFTTAWKSVFKGTKYEHSLDNYQYTGNLLDVFLATGLFEKKPMSFLAEPGDAYLNIQNHVAMCQTQYPDVLSEFAINEHGGVYGGAVGDQTGGEAIVHDYYDYPWDCIVHAKNITLDELFGDKVEQTTTKTTSKNLLHGIDIASWQDNNGINVAKVDADFVIIKVTGGDWYVNPLWKKNADRAMKAGKLVGFYHYALEKGTTANAKKEAEFFLSTLGDYAKKGILALDWEADATGLPVSYAKTWLDYVKKQTGALPFFYGYASNINTTDYSSIKDYPLWMASYLDRYIGSVGYVDKPANTWSTGAWTKMQMYQYASKAYISGYNDRLDVNVFYGTVEDWKKYCAGGGAAVTTTGKEVAKPSKNPVCYRVSIKENGKVWYAEMQDGYDTGGSTDGFGGDMKNPIRWLAIKDATYRVYTEKNGCLPWVNQYNVKDLEDGCAGDGSPILAIEIKNEDIEYAAYVGEWFDDMIGLSDTGGSNDTFAGDMENYITAVKMHRV